MNITFASKDEAYIRQMVEEGYYSNATELIRDAVRRLREANKIEYDNPMYAAVAIGEEQYARGQYKKYTPELFEEIQRNADKKLKQGKKPKPEVIPDDV